MSGKTERAGEEGDYPTEYRAYFAHFVRGDYFECHEVLEKLWLREKSRFYQALIQLAVALYHLSRGNAEGGRKLLEAAEEKLREFPSPFMGLDTQRVIERIEESRALLPPDRRDGPPVTQPMTLLAPVVKLK